MARTYRNSTEQGKTRKANAITRRQEKRDRGATALARELRAVRTAATR